MSAVTETAAEHILNRAKWQKEIFALSPRRHGLLQLKSAFELKPLRVLVHRNHPFEVVTAAIAPFLAYAGWSADFQYSSYDDSLGFTNSGDADVEVVWLDFSRYSETEQLAAWVQGRLARLRELTKSPILLANSPDPKMLAFNEQLNGISEKIPGVHVCDQAAVAEKLGDDFMDRRMSGIAASTLSSRACVELARMFGLVWIPAAAGSWIKAIAVDLDNTLYAGVLGEDGPEGVKLTSEHKKLQEELLACRTRGIFLAVISRNEAEDVTRLFEARQDFPLRLEHFSARAISWGSKAMGMKEIAAKLRIGADTILFIDDNPGELSTVASEIPAIQSLYAADPAEVTRALPLYPGVTRWKAGAADQVRVADLDAAEVRARMSQESVSPEEYWRSLESKLTFWYNPRPQVHRLHELSVKTNQFCTGFLRLPEAAIAARLEESESAIVSIALSDKLSDSGIIGALFCRWAGNTLHIEDIVVSCRALGRELESVMMAEAVRGILERKAARSQPVLEFSFVPGPRNQPAHDWLVKFTALEPQAEKRIRMEWQGSPAVLREAEGRVSIVWEE